MGGARNGGGAPRSVVDDPLLGPPPGAVEDELQGGWVEDEVQGGAAVLQQSLSPETSVPPPVAARTAVPVNGYVSSDPPRAAASPAEIGELKVATRGLCSYIRSMCFCFT